jgi:hypothetical protein
VLLFPAGGCCLSPIRVCRAGNRTPLHQPVTVSAPDFRRACSTLPASEVAACSGWIHPLITFYLWLCWPTWSIVILLSGGTVIRQGEQVMGSVRVFGLAVPLLAAVLVPSALPSAGYRHRRVVPCAE